MLKHYCRANRCAAEIRPGGARPVLMCPRHWLMVPAAIRDRFHRAAGDHPAFEDASTEYLLAAADAIEAVARREGCPETNAFRRRADARALAKEDPC